MIRKCRPDDLNQVTQIWLASNIDAHDFIPKDYWISNAPQVKAQLLLAEIYVYQQNEKIQGFIGMQENFLAGIFVDENARSAGVGKSLLDYAKTMHPSLSLQVYKKNQRAVDFYLREGFSIVTEKVDGETGEFEYLMQWSQNAL